MRAIVYGIGDLPETKIGPVKRECQREDGFLQVIHTHGGLESALISQRLWPWRKRTIARGIVSVSLERNALLYHTVSAAQGLPRLAFSNAFISFDVFSH